MEKLLIILSIILLLAVGCSNELPPEPDAPGITGNYYAVIDTELIEPEEGVVNSIRNADEARRYNLKLSDSLISKKFYYWNQSDKTWYEAALNGGTVKGSGWISNNAGIAFNSNMLSSLADENGEIFVAFYTCTKKDVGYDCHDKKWQLEVQNLTWINGFNEIIAPVVTAPEFLVLGDYYSIEVESGREDVPTVEIAWTVNTKPNSAYFLPREYRCIKNRKKTTNPFNESCIIPSQENNSEFFGGNYDNEIFSVYGTFNGEDLFEGSDRSFSVYARNWIQDGSGNWISSDWSDEKTIYLYPMTAPGVDTTSLSVDFTNSYSIDYDISRYQVGDQDIVQILEVLRTYYFADDSTKRYCSNEQSMGDCDVFDNGQSIDLFSHFKEKFGGNEFNSEDTKTITVDLTEDLEVADYVIIRTKMWRKLSGNDWVSSKWSEATKVTINTPEMDLNT